MSAIEKTIRRFLGEVIHSSEPCARVIMAQVGTNGGLMSPLTEIGVDDPQDFAGEDLGKVIERLLEIAQENTDGTGHACSYVLKAEWDDKGPRISPKFRVSVSDGVDTDEGVSEKSMVAHLMRHNEAMMRQLVSLTQAMGIQSAQAIQVLNKDLEEERRFKFKFLKKYEELEDRSHERQLEWRKQENREQQAQELFKGILPLLPVAAGKLLGTGKLGADALKGTPQYQALRAIFKDMSREQLAAMPEWLSHAPMSEMHKSALIDVIQSIGEEMTEEKTNGKHEKSAWS